MAYDASFGQWMVARRRALRLQRTELAAQVGCAAITLRKIETDERRPSLQLAELLAARLGLAAEDRPTFVRVARGELPADYLPALSLNDAPAAPDQSNSAVPRAPMRPPIRTNLPAPLTSFVGRSQELEAIPELLGAQRLVTLTGVGGVGKTRLAIEVGMRMVRSGASNFARDGVWIVELASLAQPELAPQAIASVFRLPEQPGRTMLEQIQEHLADKQLLLILDNCEHLVDTCAKIAEQLLQCSWQLRILATSREPLRVPGERAFPLQPLTLPNAGEIQIDQILSTPAAQLFVTRMDSGVGAALTVGGETAARIDSADAAAIAQICRQLDGIPLALELAAPLSQSMALTEIATQLQNQMAILTNSYRTAIPRHQTMHSALVWSYRLLAPEEQLLLATTAVFAGGWTLEAAQAVCAEESAARVLPMLTQLIAKSWMLREEWNGQRRYRLLEPVRQFAQIQLAASGMEDRVRRRHAEYFLTLAEQMHQAWDTANEGEWLDRLEPERDNLRAVNAWAISHGERRFALQFNGWLFALWIYRSTMTESNYWLEAAIAIPRHGDLPMQADELEAEVVALDTAGYAALSRSNFAQAQQWFERALELRRGGDNLAGLSRALRGCGWTAMQKGDVARARQYDDEALEVARASGDPGEIAWSLLDVGYIMMLQGELTAAQATLGQACEQMLAAGISFGAFHATIALGHVMRGLNDLERAESMYHDALRLQQRMHYVQLTSHVLEGLAGIAAVRGNPARAIRLFSAAQAHRENYALPRWTHLDEICARDMALARSQIAPAQIEVAWQEGVALTLDQAVAYALE